MTCFAPVSAYRLGCGSISFSERGDIVETLQLPCGKCLGCRIAKSQEWMVRCTHEAQLHEFSVFVTLTYDDEHLPENGSLNHRHFQLFMKKLRKKFSDVSIRYFMCGEYGPKLSRPHYHACLFGIDFVDRKLFSTNSRGDDLYESQTLTELWGLGFATVAPFSPETAGYCARYSLKKVLGSDASSHYGVLDVDTGELIQRVPEYARMSTHPGLGARWYMRFNAEVSNSDQIVVNGIKYRPPRYYDRLLSRYSGKSELSEVKAERMLKAYPDRHNCTSDRLAVRAAVKEAQLSSLKRK